MHTLLRILQIAVLSTPLLAAQDAPDSAVNSGPAAGTALTPVPCYATDGPRAGREFDAAAELGNSPGALLFIHELTRNTAPVLRGLDALSEEFSILGFQSRILLLGADRTAAEAQLKRVNASLRLASPIVLSTDGAEGPGNYALNRKAALTVVFAKDGKVTRSLALTDTGPNDVPALRSAIEALTGPIPEDESTLRDLASARLPADPEALKTLATEQALEIRRLRQRLNATRDQARRAGMQREPEGRSPMRDGPSSPQREGDPDKPAVPREGKPPEDAALLSSLRSYIRKTNDETRVDEVLAEIKTRAAESDELHAQAVEMFKLMLSIDYGTEYAQDQARAFLQEADTPEKEE